MMTLASLLYTDLTRYRQMQILRRTSFAPTARRWIITGNHPTCCEPSSFESWTTVRVRYQCSPFTPLSYQFRFRAMAHRPHPLLPATEEMLPDGSSARYRCSPATANPDTNSVPAQHNMRVDAYLCRIRLRSYSRLQDVVQGAYDPVRQHAAVCRAQAPPVIIICGWFIFLFMELPMA